MKQRSRASIARAARWSALLALVPLACPACGGDRPRKPLELRAPAWRDGEETIYDVYGADGSFVESARYRWSKVPEGWSLARETFGKPGSAELRLTADGSPLHLRFTRDDGETGEVSFESRRIRATRTKGAKKDRLEIPRPADAVDGREFYQFFRLLPLTKGYERGITMIDPMHLDATPMTVRVKAKEHLVVPAGTFQSWHLVLDTEVAGTRDMWFAVDPPHLWLKYRWPGASQVILRSYRLDAGARVSGAAEAGPRAPGSDAPLPPVNWSLAVAQLLIAMPLMVLLPLVLGIWLPKRLDVPRKVWAIGLATFPVSQIVHLPLNALLGIGGARGTGLLEGVPLPIYGLIAGLSAGLCEELARWAAMRWLLRKDRERGWAPGVVFGVGHGGIEAIIFGALAGLELLQILVIQLTGAPLDPASREAVRAALEVRADASWWLAAYAGLERLGAISCHVFMSVLVMRAVVRRNLSWLGAAVLFHTALDAPLVYKDVLTEHGTIAIVLAAGLFALVATLKLREERAPAARHG